MKARTMDVINGATDILNEIIHFASDAVVWLEL